ncbi:signal peptidase I [Erythrobacter ani]|uniref:Signal peptidase I n=1 Tax=Erythrobacter ani TaxID=2827235 RepID=A0ABS6SQK8_9SPHN|nr:signal peptidase I [Erythrobacter ani]MBV7267325.1 signal peptidase I [Erythrobacter ani]
MDVKTQTATSGAKKEGEESESLASFAMFILKLVVAVLLLRILVFSPFSIPSESMLPRLWNGDYLLAAKWSYGYSGKSLPLEMGLPDGRLIAREPERGDVVIFKHPIDNSDYIKRVIAVPGDTISMIAGQVILNGEPIPKDPIGNFDIPFSPNTSCAWAAEEVMIDPDRTVCRYQRFRETLPGGRSYEVLDFGAARGDNFEETIVPDGHMFVMGDNRDNSRDSRFPAMSGDAVGIVSQDELVGRAAIIMWSTDGSAEWLKPWTWFSAARWDRIGSTL